MPSHPRNIDFDLLLSQGFRPEMIREPLENARLLESRIGHSAPGLSRAKTHATIAGMLMSMGQHQRGVDHIREAHRHCPEAYADPDANADVQALLANDRRLGSEADGDVQQAAKERTLGRHDCAAAHEMDAAEKFLLIGDFPRAGGRLTAAYQDMAHMAPEPGFGPDGPVDYVQESMAEIKTAVASLQGGAAILHRIDRVPVRELANDPPLTLPLPAPAAVTRSDPQRGRRTARAGGRAGASRDPRTPRTFGLR